MSEIFPDDADLLAMVEDPQTGVPFIATGTAPYYLQFRQMLYRLLVNLGPLGCRVFATGPLCVQVRPGRYWLGGQLRQFPGTAADLAITDNATNSIYLSADNTAAVTTGDWPTDEHVKLAQVVSAGGGFEPESIVDLRGYGVVSSLASMLTATPGEINAALHGISANVTAARLGELTGGGFTTLHQHASFPTPLSVAAMTDAGPTSLDGWASGYVLTNAGAIAKVGLTLPANATGTTFTFAVVAGAGLRVAAPAGATICLNNATCIGGGYIDSTAVGSTVTLVAVDNATWVASSFLGKWAVQTS